MKVEKIEKLLEENEKEITKVEEDLSEHKVVGMSGVEKWITLLQNRGNLYKKRCRLLAKLIKE